MHVSVDVWTIDLTRAAWPSREERALLSANENDRLEGYLSPEAARIYAITRTSLRRLLAAQLAVDPADIRLETGTHGKPAIAGNSELFFNVSHSSRSALIAFCEVAPVGVDVEEKRVDESSELAKTICAPSELASLPVDSGDRRVSITRLWTRKEAVLKSCGVGLSLQMTSIDLGQLVATEGTCLISGLGRAAWCDLDLPGFAAVAVFDGRVTSVGIRFRRYEAASEGPTGAGEHVH